MLLFVNDYQAQLLELDIWLEKPVGSYDDVQASLFQLFSYHLLL